MTTIANGKHILKNAIYETIWPTRCAICDKNGFLLCPNCASALPFIDNNKSCKKCGEPYGKIQCCGCSPINKLLTEEQKQKFKPNYDRCISVLTLNKDTGRIVTLNKDAGERRLSNIMAYFMTASIPKSWINKNTFITYIPASKEAIIKRGFDHCELIAKSISSQLKINYIKCFNRPSSKDQRKLGRSERKTNLKNKFILDKNILKFITSRKSNFILIDDVYTTGATLNSAAEVLKLAGSQKVYCITFARTF